jgi:hypothetical protein
MKRLKEAFLILLREGMLIVGAGIYTTETLLRTIPHEVTRYQTINTKSFRTDKLVSIVDFHPLERVAL